MQQAAVIGRSPEMHMYVPYRTPGQAICLPFAPQPGIILAMKTTYVRRLERLTRAQQEQQVDVLAIVPGANLRYLTGLEMHPSERVTLVLFPQGGEPAFVLPELEAPRAEANLGIKASFYTYSDVQGPSAAFRRAASDLHLEGKAIGVEHLRMRVLELRLLEEHVNSARFVDGEPLLSQLRMLKDEEEIAAMRRAAAVNEDCFRQVQAQIKPGVTEQELAAIWQKATLDAASGELPEAPIVASGLNGASPHAWATSRRIEEGDLVTIDGFLRVEGYYSDITRTYAVGEIDEELERIYSIVQEANAAGREIIKPGIQAQEVDGAARQVIEKAGYGEYFIHRTGHGLGLEIHEPPYMVQGSEVFLEPSMAFTVEPGIYLPGRGGVRIEDNVLVTDYGCETLTTLPRELIRL
ncbi:MAG TPA: Xaa-Pro peptidase family protein, partial [Anaerolineae bacterium]|nr:Xaa-Pro peptidase family protein [Anaerolineae bacterium]